MNWTYSEKVLAVLGIAAFAVGLIIGDNHGSRTIAQAVCEEREYSSYEILPDNTVRCFTILTLEE